MEAKRWIDLLGGQVPVDVFGAAAGRGVQVVEESLALNLTGALICEADTAALINIEVGEAMPWRRYTCALLLGHFAQLPDSPTCHIHFDRRTLKGKSADAFEPANAFAHEFALNLLMPEDTLRNLHAQNPGLFELARRCGVPPGILKEWIDWLRLPVLE